MHHRNAGGGSISPLSFTTGVDVNYTTLTVKTTANWSGRYYWNVADKTYNDTYTGHLISPFIRVNIPIGSTFLIGFGPYLTLGSVTMQGSASPIATDTIRITRFGGEVVFAVNSLWVFNPFLRLGVGADDFTQMRQTAIDHAFAGCTYYCLGREYRSYPYEIALIYNGFQYQIFFGTSTRIWQNLKWYWQLGIVGGGGNVKAKIREIKTAGNGHVEQPVTVTYESHIGFVIGAGIAYEF